MNILTNLNFGNIINNMIVKYMNDLYINLILWLYLPRLFSIFMIILILLDW